MKVEMTAFTEDGRRDDDVLVLRCLPPPSICDPCGGDNPAGGPDQLVVSTAGTGTDLDNGWTGMSHNFPIPPHSQVNLCLSGCDASTNPMCDVSTTPVGTGTINPTFGPPLPLVAQGIPVCVINRYQHAPTGKVNVQTGGVTSDDPLAIDLFSDVHLTLNAQVCPRCISGGTPSFGQEGTCDGGPNLGKACIVDSVLQVTQAQGNKTYALSGGCPPDPGQLAGTLNIALRLTTGTTTLIGPTPCKEGQNNPFAAPVMDDDCPDNGACIEGSCTGNACVGRTPDGNTCIDAKGGLSQACCATQTNLPCFTTKSGGSIIRTGNADPPLPAWPDTSYPKTSSNGILVSTFCEAPTEKAVINETTGLPGPGALIVPVTETLVKCGGK